MTVGGSVEARDRFRLFVALSLPDDVVDALVAWQERELAGVAETRPVSRGNLHVTLAFLGGRAAGDVEPVTRELRAAARAARLPVLTVARYRETRSVGMLVLRDDGGHATALAADVHGRLERLGVYRPEQREWLPHVTVLRFRERPRLDPSLPVLGAFSPSEAAVYHSVLRPSGAQYEVLEAARLGG